MARTEMFTAYGGWLKPAASAALAFSIVIGPTSSQGVSEVPGFFAQMEGSWRGEGSLTLSDGASERIRCRADYLVEQNGHKLQQDMRCASDSYTMNVLSDLTYKPDAGIVTGSWEETSNGFKGLVTGPAKDGHMKAWVVGKNFRAELAVVTWGNNQTVTIRPQQLEVTEVAVKMKRDPTKS